MGFKIQMIGLTYLLVSSIESAIVLDSATLDTAWYHYKVHFNKDYDEVTEMTRKPAFLKSLQYVITKNIEHDLTGQWYMAGLNAVADFTKEEIRCVKPPTHHAGVDGSLLKEISSNAEKRNDFDGTAEMHESEKGKDVYEIEASRPVHNSVSGNCFCLPKKTCPSQINWVDEKRVFTVGRQKCGDCYAWAATYALSSAWAIKKNTKPLDLSVQQAKDCSYHIYEYNDTNFNTNYMNEGCDGGNPWYVYDGIQTKTKDIMVETSDYLPYNRNNGSLSCDTAKVNRGKAGKATIKSHSGIANLTDCELEKALQKGPVTADMCMSDHVQLWKTGNKKGLYTNFNCTLECQDEMLKLNQTVEDTNHEVLIVGYTPTSWIVQNSYGTNWAHNGIGHFKRDSRYPRICNLALVIQWPEV